MNMKFKHFAPSYSYLGYQYPIEKAEAVLIPVPYDSTTSYQPGTRNGPHALISASRQLEAYDIELGGEIAAKVGIHTLDEMEPCVDSPKETVNRVEDLTEEIISKKKFPIIIGGEHTISIGAVRALKRKYSDLSVLAIDAHADLRDKFEDSIYSHACVNRRIREEIDKAVQVGVRSASAEEMKFIEKEKIENSIQFGDSIDRGKVLRGLSDNVYITFDLDALDPSIMPAVGTPEPGGLNWPEVMRLLRSVCEAKNIVGFDVVELSPTPSSTRSEFLAAKLVYKMLGYSMLLK
jgi:agmatinase